MKKITAIYGSTYKDLERENKKLKQMIQRDRDEVLKEIESINNQYLTELFIQQNKINKAIEYIENLPVMFYPDDFYEENHKEIEWNRKELLEILGDKE